MDSTYIPKEDCFFQLSDQDLLNANIQLVFVNNSADIAGSVLYGGAVDNYTLTGMDSHSSGKVFNTIVHIDNDSYHCAFSQISSEPLHICPCENNLPVCNKFQDHVPRTVYPGETFQVSVVAAGQRGGTVPSTVRSVIMRNEQGNLHEYHYLQPANNTCTTLSYTMFTLSQYTNIMLYVEDSPCPTFEGKYIYSLLHFSEHKPNLPTWI